MSAAGLLSRVVTRVKGESYEIDPRIPVGYLARTVLGRLVMRARGRLLFGLRKNAPFVGAGARVRARRMLRTAAGVTLGPGSYVDAMSTGGVTLGPNTSVGRNTRIECTGSLRTLGAGMSVGANVGLGADNFYGSAGGIEIGDETIIGSAVSFHSENHRFDDPQLPIRLQGVTHSGITVGRNCWIGARVTVLDGAVLGDGCVVAAGAVVAAGEYGPDAILGGIPARELRSRVAAAAISRDHFPERSANRPR